MSSYRLGLAVVALTIALAAGLCLATVDPSARAGHNLAAAVPPLGDFKFTERGGRTITQDDLKDRVWIACFFFTRCRTSCPVITGAMGRVQKELEGTPVQSVSITVDPEHDNTQNLLHFARQYRADPDRWWFLTGDREATYDLIRSGFLQAVAQTTEAERQQVPGIEEFEHSSRLTLLDRGNQIVGMYDARDDAELAELVKRARELERVGSAPSWARKLPAVNATLNGSCAVLLVLGLVLIRNRKAKAHTVVMASALALSGAFLACYLTYHYQVGSVRFPGTGQARVVYFTILLSHTVLAVVMLPLIVMTVLRAVRKRFELHKRVSTIAYPIWLYVSVTGVVIYWMLYQINWAIA